MNGQLLDDHTRRYRDIDPVMARLVHAAETIPGWTPADQLLTLYMTALLAPAGAIVELGVWCGRSTIALGLAAQRSGRRLHAVDIFPERADWVRNSDGSWSINMVIDGVTVTSSRDHTVWDDAFQSAIVPIYAAASSPRILLDQALDRFGLRDVVAVHRGTGAMFRASHPGLRLGMLFLDGDHSENAVCEDIEGFLPMMLPGGVLCFDDAFTVYDGVDRAIIDSLLDRRPPMVDYGLRITRKMFVARLLG